MVGLVAVGVGLVVVGVGLEAVGVGLVVVGVGLVVVGVGLKLKVDDTASTFLPSITDFRLEISIKVSIKQRAAAKISK